MGNIFGIIEFFKSEFAVCSANNFLSFGACGKLYLALAGLALLYWSLYGKWWTEGGPSKKEYIKRIRTHSDGTHLSNSEKAAEWEDMQPEHKKTKKKK